jgi:hypothetical protein
MASDNLMKLLRCRSHTADIKLSFIKGLSMAVSSAFNTDSPLESSPLMGKFSQLVKYQDSPLHLSSMTVLLGLIQATGLSLLPLLVNPTV